MPDRNDRARFMGDLSDTGITMHAIRQFMLRSGIYDVPQAYDMVQSLLQKSSYQKVGKDNNLIYTADDWIIIMNPDKTSVITMYKQKSNTFKFNKMLQKFKSGKK